MEKALLALIPFIRSMVLKAFRATGKACTDDALDDQTQECVLFLLEGALAKFDPTRGIKLSTYVSTVAFNFTMGAMRKKRNPLDYRNRTSDDDETTNDISDGIDSVTPEDTYSAYETNKRYCAALEALSTTDKAIIDALNDNAWERGCADKVQSLAASLGFSPGYVTKRASILRSKLRDILAA